VQQYSSSGGGGSTGSPASQLWNGLPSQPASLVAMMLFVAGNTLHVSVAVADCGFSSEAVSIRRGRTEGQAVS
jgi:hypothetical protein